MRSILIVFLVSWTLAQHTFGKVGRVTFEEMVQRSDLIVVAEVLSVSDPDTGKRYATARITEVWKGAPAEQVQFLASPTFFCDNSTAKVGETVLLFLTSSSQTPSYTYTIVHRGRGRIPLRTVNGRTGMRFGEDVIFPEDTPTFTAPAPQVRIAATYVDLVVARELVKILMSTTEK